MNVKQSPDGRTCVSGVVHLRVVAGNTWTPAVRQGLQVVVEQFLRAIQLGALPGSTDVVCPFSMADEVYEMKFDVVAVDLGCFHVLQGMLRHFSMVIAPIRDLWARWDGPFGTADLLSNSGPAPTTSEPPYFALDFSMRAGLAPPVVVQVVFGRPLDNEEKDRLADEIMVWVALLQGGYPCPGQLPGDSAIGPVTVRFDDVQTLRVSADCFLASDDCFEPLKALLCRWNTWVPVCQLEVE